jgi:putative redox protein
MTKMKATYLGDLRTECIHLESGAKILTDAPKDNGGLGREFSPTDFLASALGTCMLTMVGLAARKLGIDVKGMTVEIEKEMVSAPERRVGKVILELRCPQSFSSYIQEKLEQAALDCPVHHSLHPEIKKEVAFVWGL